VSRQQFQDDYEDDGGGFNPVLGFLSVSTFVEILEQLGIS